MNLSRIRFSIFHLILNVFDFAAVQYCSNPESVFLSGMDNRLVLERVFVGIQDEF